MKSLWDFVVIASIYYKHTFPNGNEHLAGWLRVLLVEDAQKYANPGTAMGLLRIIDKNAGFPILLKPKNIGNQKSEIIPSPFPCPWLSASSVEGVFPGCGVCADRGTN